MTPLKACKPLRLLIFLGCALFPSLSMAQSDDPGLVRALDTDSPQIENTYYVETTFNNDFSPHHGLYLYGEGLFTLSKDWGVEADFPDLVTLDPLGKYPVGLMPFGVFVRYEAWHFGGWNDETAGALSFQAGGSYGFPNTFYRWIGSSWSLEALGGYRMGRVFVQADYTYQGAIDPQVQSQWQFNQSIGYRLTTNWYVQVEADISASASFDDISWTYMPQIAFQPGDWLFEFGENIGEGPAGYTELMVARAL
ncbi:MAG TPA: hypothetical protein VJ873_07815 [bacterium]|nr:hypothetical protein [bacterium]